MFMVAAMLGAVLGGCGQGDAAQGSTPAASGDASKTPAQVELRVLTRASGTESIAKAFAEMNAEFMKRNPDIKIIDESINEESAYNDKLKTDIASGNLPALFRMQGSANLKPYIENGMFMNVDEIIEGDPEWASGFTDGAFDLWRFDDIEGTYGIPMEASAMGFFYNKELFQQAGIEKTPETWDELLTCVEKLKAIGVTPISLGAKDNWRAGHLQNAIMYRLSGVQSAIDLGNRKIKWTDPAIVDSFAKFAKLNEMGAFTQNAAGVDYEQEKVDFMTGKAAMEYNGSWALGEYEGCDIVDQISVFPFPSFTDKPEFAGDYRYTLNAYILNGQLEGAEKEALIKYAKFITGKEVSQYYVDTAKYITPRKDVTMDEATVGRLCTELDALTPLVKNPGSDVFTYDPIASMQDVTRNAAVGVLLGQTPEEACAQIQTEIDKNS